jgi:hypothetical protein
VALGIKIRIRDFRQISDISYALLCIVGRNCNERHPLGHIIQLLMGVFGASNQAVGSANLAGRAIQIKGLYL